MTRAARLVLSALIVAACTSEPSGPQPGTLRVILRDPNAGSDGALLVTLSGPASPSNLIAAAGDTVWGGPFTGTSNEFAVTGALANGAIVTFDVPDVTVASQYKATLMQAAATSDYSLRPLASYTLTVSQ
jgi:hypothetical protein